MFARHSIGLDIGLEGEEGVHLLCSMASDFAAGSRYATAFTAIGFDDEGGDSYACTMGLITLDEWLSTLIGSDMVSAPNSNAQADKAFKAWCQRHCINFKHVADLSCEVEVMERSLLAQAWVRHVVLRGISTHSGWDLLIPLTSLPTCPSETRFSISNGCPSSLYRSRTRVGPPSIQKS